MKFIVSFLVIILATVCTNVYAYDPESDSVQLSAVPVQKIKKHPDRYNYKSLIAPAVLITYGVISREAHWMMDIDQQVSEWMQGETPNHASDYIQYVPMAALYGLELFGLKPKHSFGRRTLMLACSFGVSSLTVQSLKNTAFITRPDGSTKNSFPSGHTATAFVGAHLLHKEYGHISPWISVAGYATATTVGYMRIRNNRHWTSDVVMGAGVGMMSVEACYLVTHLITKSRNSRNLDMAFTPVVGGGAYGMGFSCVF